MTSTPNLAEVASLIGDSSRASILLALLGGIALPSSELARAAKITPQTASGHLAKLVEGGLLATESAGRHRYYRIASPEVGHALEALNIIATAKPVRSLRESNHTRSLRFARTCYDHLAGAVGVALHDRLVELGLIQVAEPNYVVTRKGALQFNLLGIDVEELQRGRRNFARKCLDWSERRHHLAGAVGSALTRRFFDLGWMNRIDGIRAVRFTDVGKRAIYDRFGIQIGDHDCIK